MTMFERAMSAATIDQCLDVLNLRRETLSLLQIRQLSRKLAGFGAPATALRVAVLRTYTTELLRPYWEFEGLLHGLALEMYDAPYGSIVHEARAASPLAAHDPEITYIMLRWEDLAPELSLPVMRLTAERRKAVFAEAVDQLLGMIDILRSVVRGVVVVTLLPRMHGGELGSFGTMISGSDDHAFAEAKARLGARLHAEAPSTYLLDIDQVAFEVGRTNLFDARMWFSSRSPFSEVGAQAVVKQLMKIGALLRRPTAKCIVLDCDNTLWGGIVGEDGMTGIALGPEYPGAPFVAFQRRLLEFQQRGVLLALCSKNDPASVLEVLRDHPHQLIREANVAAMRVNWASKSDNLRALANELNLGLDSFIFVDDSPHECLAVRQECPAVSVVQVPARPDAVPFCLDQHPRLEILALSAEDRERTAMYAQERQRRALAAETADSDRYLESLRMEMQIAIDDARHLTRVAQLTQKTNQFNLTTRRYTEDDIRAFIDDPAVLVADFSLRDIFGDSGIVGVAIVRSLDDASAEVDSFLMSCRVIGRRAETAFLAALLERLRQGGIGQLFATYIPTSKNGIVRDFWRENGFAEAERGRFAMDLTGWSAPDLPIDVRSTEPPASLPGFATTSSSAIASA